jgi:hypothetical protein
MQPWLGVLGTVQRALRVYETPGQSGRGDQDEEPAHAPIVAPVTSATVEPRFTVQLEREHARASEITFAGTGKRRELRWRCADAVLLKMFVLVWLGSPLVFAAVLGAA